MPSIERNIEKGAGLAKGAQIMEIPPLTFKEVLRHPVDFLIAGAAAVLILGTAWLEYRLHGSARRKSNSGDKAN